MKKIIFLPLLCMQLFAELPLYTIHVTGKPSVHMQAESVAKAKAKGIRITYDNRGCIASGLIKISQENKTADAFYRSKFGNNWLAELDKK